MATSASLSTSRPRAPHSARPPFQSNDGRLTVRDWARLPETKPHYELIGGILKRKMATRSSHAYAAFRLALQLAFWGDSRDWMVMTEGTGIRADDFNGFVPDVIMFAPDTHPRPDAVYVGGAFLVAEVLSPSTAKDDRAKKMEGYARAEVEIYLLLDAKKRTMEVYHLDGKAFGEPEVLGENDVWTPAELPELRLELARLWMPARKGK